MLFSLLLSISLSLSANKLPVDSSFITAGSIPNKLQEAKIFCRKKEYDTTVCFLLDLSIHNGRKRFFVCDMKTGKIITGGLVTHGSCNTRYLSQVLYSNQPGCGCSSFGKYQVGAFYKGGFGDAYKLYGLDSSKAMRITGSLYCIRTVVFLKMKFIPTRSATARMHNGGVCLSERN